MRDAARPVIAPGAGEPAPFRQVVAEVLETLHLELDAAGVRLETDLATDALGTTPPSVLRLIVSNLVKNALEALPGGGTVRVSLHDQCGEVRLTVADDGPGMSEATLLRRSNATSPRRSAGPGSGSR